MSEYAAEPAPELEDNAELLRRFNGPAKKGEYLWRVTYRIKGQGKKGRERPNVARVLAVGQIEAEEAVKYYMLHFKGVDATIDSAYNAGQASYYAHWWFRDAGPS